MRGYVFALCLALPVLMPGEEWRLGTSQAVGTVGINAMADRGPGVEPSAGFSIAAGFGRWVAATGGYAWNRLASIREETCLYGTCFRADAGAVIHEWSAGLRINASNPGRATPYLLALAGLVQARASGNVMGYAFSISEVKPAFGAGGGLDIRAGGPLLLVLDLRLMKPGEMRWYARAGIGVGLQR